MATNKIIVSPDWHLGKQRFVNAYLKSGKPIENIQWYLEHDDSNNDWTQINAGYEQGLTIEQIDFYAKQDFSSSQQRTICESLVKGIPLETLKLYARPRISKRNMSFIDWEVRKGYLTNDDIELLADCAYEYSKEQLEQIAAGIKDKLPREEIDKYNKPWYSAKDMMKMRYKAQKKPKDRYYKNIVHEENKKFFATPNGITLQCFVCLCIFVSLVLLGIWAMTNPVLFTSYPEIMSVLDWITTVVKYIVIASAVLELFRATLFFSHDANAALGHFINAILSIVLVCLAKACLPNVILIMGFQFLIAIMHGNIHSYFLNHSCE